MKSKFKTTWLDWLNRIPIIIGTRFNLIEPKREGVMITIIIRRLFGLVTLKPVRVRPELRGHPRGSPPKTLHFRHCLKCKVFVVSVLALVLAFTLHPSPFTSVAYADADVEFEAIDDLTVSGTAGTIQFTFRVTYDDSDHSNLVSVERTV